MGEHRIDRVWQALLTLYWTLCADGDDALEWECSCGEDPEGDARYGGRCPRCRMSAAGLDNYRHVERGGRS